MAFGASFGFLGGWACLGTTLRAELLNGVVDLVPLTVSGWLVDLAVGRDVPQSGQQQPCLEGTAHKDIRHVICKA